MSKRKELFKIILVDFTKDKDEPAYDVEIYIDDKFQLDRSEVVSTEINNKINALKLAENHIIKQVADFFRDYQNKNQFTN